jgi:hypothetical protein
MDVLSLSFCLECVCSKKRWLVSMFWSLSSLGSSKSSKYFLEFNSLQSSSGSLMFYFSPAQKDIYSNKRILSRCSVCLSLLRGRRNLQNLFWNSTFQNHGRNNGCFCFSSAQKTYTQMYQVCCHVLSVSLSLSSRLKEQFALSSFKVLGILKIKVISRINCSKSFDLASMFCLSLFLKYIYSKNLAASRCCVSLCQLKRTDFRILPLWNPCSFPKLQIPTTCLFSLWLKDVYVQIKLTTEYVLSVSLSLPARDDAARLHPPKSRDAPKHVLWERFKMFKVWPNVLSLSLLEIYLSKFRGTPSMLCFSLPTQKYSLVLSFLPEIDISNG